MRIAEVYSAQDVSTNRWSGPCEQSDTYQCPDFLSAFLGPPNHAWTNVFDRWLFGAWFTKNAAAEFLRHTGAQTCPKVFGSFCRDFPWGSRMWRFILKHIPARNRACLVSFGQKHAFLGLWSGHILSDVPILMLRLSQEVWGCLWHQRVPKEISLLIN